MSISARIKSGLLQMLSEYAGKAGFVVVMMGVVGLFIDFWKGSLGLLLGCSLMAISFYTWQGRSRKT